MTNRCSNCSLTECQRLVFAGRMWRATPAKAAKISRRELAILIDGQDEYPTRFVTARTGGYHVALAVGEAWSGSVHHAASTNRAMIAGTRFSILFQDGEVPTTKPPLDNECSGTTVACYGVEWRAVGGEKWQPI
jgi:hypothetical protein